MTFERLWTVGIKQWKLVITCLIVIGAGANIGSTMLTPVYQSTVLVRVALSSTTNQTDINSLLASDQLVQTEATLVISNTVTQEVASHRRDLTATQITSETTAAVKTNTQLFEIDVQDPIPQRAADLANDIAQTFVKQQLQQLQQSDQRAQQQLQQKVGATQQQIDDLTNKIKTLETDEITRTQANTLTPAQLSALQMKTQAQLNVLQTNLDTLQQQYNQWENMLVQLELTATQNSDFLRIVQTAMPNSVPVRPNVLLNTTAGLVVGFLLGMLLAVVWEGRRR